MAEKEYWRWPEYRKTVSDKDWKSAKMITGGIDVGSVSSKAMIFVDNEPFAFSLMRTGSSSPDSAINAMNWAMEGTGMEMKDINYFVGTGYGRINIPFAKKTITEIACHGRGANFIWGPSVKTILDMGGQDCKAIHVDEKGKVTQFLMNDKCAAGTGRGMEVFADLLGIPIEEVGEMSLTVDEEPPAVSSTCVVFAKSEGLGLLRQGWSKAKVLAAYCSAMAHRVVTLLDRVGVEKDFVCTGGISKNIGVVSRIEKELNIKALPIDPKYDPQLAGATGACLFARDLLLKQQKSA
ncbi:MAG: benzoyl-CoA reductase, bzd-type, subunit Q, partial [Dehalococcoidia bacterium]|nr:benzoyl-CoA reductase, bzd-type, subunit Q [Dehalococcoidia bacterium]